MTDPAKVAETLSDAQRRAVGKGYFISMNMNWVDAFDTLEGLEAQGLATREDGISLQGCHVIPTKLGLAVREILLARSEGRG